MTEKTETVAEDINLAIGQPITPGDFDRTIKELPRARKSTIQYTRSSRGIVGDKAYYDALYDLAEISRVADIESALAVSFRKHRELLLKEGFRLESKNPEVLKRIKKRIAEIEIQSGQSFYDIMREFAYNLIKFHTTFLFLRRDRERSTGNQIRFHGKKLEPIAALEIPDPTTMRVEQNKTGNITGWEQNVEEQSQSVRFAPDEIIVITMDKKSGFVFGTPYCLSVLDDILALRRLEELVGVITTKHAFPTIQHKIGSEKHPARVYTNELGQKTREIDEAKMQIEAMTPDACLVTSERHEIVVVGVKDQAIDLMPYLEYFRERVRSGLRLADVDVGRGEGQSRSTAMVITKAMVDAVRDYQTAISNGLTFFFLNMLLLEERVDLTEENQVRLVFPPIDQEEARAREMHSMTLYQGQVITEEESRAKLGLEPLTDAQRSGMFLNLVELPLTKAKKAENKSSEGGGGTAASLAKPQNQYGRLSTKPSIPKNSALETALSIWDMYSYNLSTIDNKEDGIEREISALFALISAAIRPTISDLLKETMGNTYSPQDEINFFSGLVKKELRKICNRANLILHKNNLSFNSIVDSLKVEVEMVVGKLIDLADAFGTVEKAKKMNLSVLKVGAKTFEVKNLTARALLGLETE